MFIWGALLIAGVAGAIYVDGVLQGLALALIGASVLPPLLLVVGLLFMVYPYFATSVTTLVGIGLVLGGSLWYALRLGW